MGRTEDRRKNKDQEIFVCMTDAFLSGWGYAANGRSIYVIACENMKEANYVLKRAKERPEMKRIRITSNIPRNRSPNDHMAIEDRAGASWFFEGYQEAFETVDA